MIEALTRLPGRTAGVHPDGIAHADISGYNPFADNVPAVVVSLMEQDTHGNLPPTKDCHILGIGGDDTGVVYERTEAGSGITPAEALPPQRPPEMPPAGNPGDNDWCPTIFDYTLFCINFGREDSAPKPLPTATAVPEATSTPTKAATTPVSTPEQRQDVIDGVYLMGASETTSISFQIAIPDGQGGMIKIADITSNKVGIDKNLPLQRTIDGKVWVPVVDSGGYIDAELLSGDTRLSGLLQGYANLVDGSWQTVPFFKGAYYSDGKTYKYSEAATWFFRNFPDCANRPSEVLRWAFTFHNGNLEYLAEYLNGTSTSPRNCYARPPAPTAVPVPPTAEPAPPRTELIPTADEESLEPFRFPYDDKYLEFMKDQSNTAPFRRAAVYIASTTESGGLTSSCEGSVLPNGDIITASHCIWEYAENGHSKRKATVVPVKHMADIQVYSAGSDTGCQADVVKDSGRIKDQLWPSNDNIMFSIAAEDLALLRLRPGCSIETTKVIFKSPPDSSFPIEAFALERFSLDFRYPLIGVLKTNRISAVNPNKPLQPRLVFVQEKEGVVGGFSGGPVWCGYNPGEVCGVIIEAYDIKKNQVRPGSAEEIVRGWVEQKLRVNPDTARYIVVAIPVEQDFLR